jgi:hypothetical protein
MMEPMLHTLVFRGPPAKAAVRFPWANGTVRRPSGVHAVGTHLGGRAALFGKKPGRLKKTGNLRAVQLLLGPTKLENTVRYLGVEVDDTLSISEQVEL